MSFFCKVTLFIALLSLRHFFGIEGIVPSGYVVIEIGGEKKLRDLLLFEEALSVLVQLPKFSKAIIMWRSKVAFFSLEYMLGDSVRSKYVAATSLVAMFK